MMYAVSVLNYNKQLHVFVITMITLITPSICYVRLIELLIWKIK